MQKFAKVDVVNKNEELVSVPKKHGLKGRPSNNKIAPQKMTEIVSFLNSTYGSSLPSLAVLVLKVEENLGIKVSRETLRKILKEQKGMAIERVRREGRYSPGQKILVTVIGLDGSLDSQSFLMLALDRGANELLGCQKICPQFFAKKNRLLKEFLEGIFFEYGYPSEVELSHQMTNKEELATFRLESSEKKISLKIKKGEWSKHNQRILNKVVELVKAEPQIEINSELLSRFNTQYRTNTQKPSVWSRKDS